MPCTQTYGVTVAQVILVHFVEVRILVGLPFFLFSRRNLALPGRALRRSPLQSRTPVRSCRFSLAKPVRLCDIVPELCLLEFAPFVGLRPTGVW